MRVDRNILANFFNFMGDALESFNPSAFRFLSAVLPYLTPIPVAWLTSDRASEFLNFPPWVAFIFVFGLEGMGLWFTSLLVDAFVEAIRSRRWGPWGTVLLFVSVVGSYVYLLVNLNVTLEKAKGNINEPLSKVVTLMCFLPLITGIGNGYYKLKLDRKTELEQARESDRAFELRKLEENNRTKVEIAKVKASASKNTSETVSKVPPTFGTSKTGRPSPYETSVFDYLDKAVLETGKVPTFSDIVKEFNIPQSTASRLRNKWIDERKG